jgi:O-acetyl-ADP-ribose deacetylase (regulator of RNase III)
VIEVVVGDITRLRLDVVVNAANSSLLGGGGVDGAIHRAAGPLLRRYCSDLGGCPVGEARLSPGFQLPARWLVHTVGPIWRGGAAGESELLANCYRNSFELARKQQARSIAFPGISTGAYGYPHDAAAEVAVRVMREYQPHFQRIVACCFRAQDAQRYRQLLPEPN